MHLIEFIQRGSTEEKNVLAFSWTKRKFDVRTTSMSVQEDRSVIDVDQSVYVWVYRGRCVYIDMWYEERRVTEFSFYFDSTTFLVATHAVRRVSMNFRRLASICTIRSCRDHLFSLRSALIVHETIEILVRHGFNAFRHVLLIDCCCIARRVRRWVVSLVWKSIHMLWSNTNKQIGVMFSQSVWKAPTGDSHFLGGD